MQKANKVGAHYALILGEKEVQENKITIKKLTTGDQFEISRNELSSFSFEV